MNFFDDGFVSHDALTADYRGRLVFAVVKHAENREGEKSVSCALDPHANDNGIVGRRRCQCPTP